MKIKCVTNKVSSIPKEILIKYKISYERFSVEENKEYLVYALKTYLGFIWYCICDETFLFFPIWKPCSLFEIIDPRLSRYWIFNLDKDKKEMVPFFSFPEWANDPYFYGELLEGNSDDLNSRIFKKYKELMDLEFPDSTITETAQIGDQEWLICGKCFDAWQSKSDKNALVKCPKCQTIYNNPRYLNELPHSSSS